MAHTRLGDGRKRTRLGEDSTIEGDIETLCFADSRTNCIRWG